MQAWNELAERKLWLRREFRTYQDRNTELFRNISILSESDFKRENAILLQKMDDIEEHNKQNDDEMYACARTLSLEELGEISDMTREPIARDEIKRRTHNLRPAF